MDGRSITAPERRGIRALVLNECANYDTVDKLCLAGAPCPMLSRDNKKICGYFRKSVLPLNPTLEASLFELDVQKKVCAVCEKEFVPASNRQAYCSQFCEISGNRIKSRARMEKMREKKGVNVTI